MKHKKFVKQLQANGFRRNTAECVALLAQIKGVPYFKALGDVLHWIRMRAAQMLGHNVLLPAGTCGWLSFLGEGGGND